MATSSTLTPTEVALRREAERDPSSAAMAVLVDLWAEMGHQDRATRTRVLVFEQSRRIRSLFAGMMGTSASVCAQENLRPPPPDRAFLETLSRVATHGGTDQPARVNP